MEAKHPLVTRQSGFGLAPTLRSLSFMLSPTHGVRTKQPALGDGVTGYSVSHQLVAFIDTERGKRHGHSRPVSRIGMARKATVVSTPSSNVK